MEFCCIAERIAKINKSDCIPYELANVFLLKPHRRLLVAPCTFYVQQFHGSVILFS